MDVLAKLDEVCNLFAEGHAKAAKAVWSSLPEDFRLRTMKFVLFVLQNRNYLEELADSEVAFRTKCGTWDLGRDKIVRMATAVQHLAQS